MDIQYLCCPGKIASIVVFVALLCINNAAAQQKPVEAAPKPPSVQCLAFSPDGKSLAVAHSVSNSLTVWDIAKRERKFVVKEKGSVSSVAYSPSGALIAIATGTTVKLLDPTTGEARQELASHKGTVRCVAFTPDGKQILSGGNDHKLNLWNLSTGQIEHTFSDFKDNLLGVEVSLDGKWLATTSHRDGVKLWNFAQLDKPVHEYPSNQHLISQVPISPDSHLLLIPSIALVDVPSGKLILTFSDYLNYVECAAISPDGRWMASTTFSLSINLLPFQNPAGPEQEHQITSLMAQFNDDDYAKREAASKKLAALGLAALPQLRANLQSPSAEVRIRCRSLIDRLANADFGVKLVGHAMQTHWVTFSPDSKTLASGDWDGIVKLWDVATAKEIVTLEPN
jgi:WD40 repeat protein